MENSVSDYLNTYDYRFRHRKLGEVRHNWFGTITPVAQVSYIAAYAPLSGQFHWPSVACTHCAPIH